MNTIQLKNKVLKQIKKLKNKGLTEKQARENLVYFLNRSKESYDKYLKSSKRVP